MFKQLEKQTFLLYFKGGIFELLFGYIFIIYAVNTWFDMTEIQSPYWMRLLIIPVSIVLSLVKVYLTKTRIGSVSFLKKRRWMFFIILFFALTWFSGFNTFMYTGLVFAFTTPFLLMLNPESHHSYLRIGLMSGAGLIFCVFGLSQLVQFLKKIPKTHKHE